MDTFDYTCDITAFLFFFFLKGEHRRNAQKRYELLQCSHDPTITSNWQEAHAKNAFIVNGTLVLIGLTFGLYKLIFKM